MALGPASPPAQQSAQDPNRIKTVGSSSSQRPHIQRLCTQTGANACSRNLFNAESPVFQSLKAALQPVSWFHGPKVSQPGLCIKNCHLHYLVGQRGLSQTLSDGSLLTSLMLCDGACLALTGDHPHWAAQQHQDVKPADPFSSQDRRRYL